MNGTDFYQYTLQANHPLIFTQAAFPAFVKWTCHGSPDTNGSKSSIEVSYDLSLLLEEEVDFLTGNMATLSMYFQGTGNGTVTTNPVLKDLADADSSRRAFPNNGTHCDFQPFSPPGSSLGRFERTN